MIAAPEIIVKLLEQGVFHSPRLLALSLLDFFDRNIALYWLIFSMLVCPIVFSIIKPENFQSRRAKFLIYASISLVVFWGRWPWFAVPELNPDEGFSLSAALKLLYDPVYWRSIVGTTHGPIVHYILAAGSLGSWPLDFALARLIGCLLVSTSLCFCWITLRMIADVRTVSCAILPVLLFISLSKHFDFHAFNAEMPAMLQISVAVFMAMKIFYNKVQPNRLEIVLLALILGLSPLIKLQILPIALFITLIGGIFIFIRSIPSRSVLRNLLIYAITGIFPVLIAVLLAYRFGVLNELWNNAVLFNLSYASRIQSSLSDKIFNILNLINSEISSRCFFKYSFALSLVFFGFTLLMGRVPKYSIWALMLWVISFLCVALPGNPFGHYLMFLVIPTFYFLAMTLFEFAELLRVRFKTTSNSIGGLQFLSLAPLLLVGALQYAIPDGHAILGKTFDRQFVNNQLAVKSIIATSGVGEAVPVWGWADWIYSRAGVVPATRYPNAFLQIEQHPLRQYFIEQYRKDLEKTKPGLLVEAIGPEIFGYHDLESQGIFAFPDIAGFFKGKYVLFGNDQSIKIYISKKRFKKISDWAQANPNYEIILNQILSELAPARTALLQRIEHVRIEHGIVKRWKDMDKLFQALIAEGTMTARDLTYLRTEVILRLRIASGEECLKSLQVCLYPKTSN